MAVVKMKEPVVKASRSIELTCAAGVKCEISAAGHAVISDEPVERGGGDEGPSPLVYFTASLAACQTVQIVKVAEAMRFNHGAIHVKASTTTDRLEGAHDKNIILRFSEAEMIIDIETDESEQKLERLKLLSEDRCPVGSLLEAGGAVVKTVWNVLPMPA